MKTVNVVEVRAWDPLVCTDRLDPANEQRAQLN